MLRNSTAGRDQLPAFLEHKDAAQAYYSVMKLWVGAFDESEWATRSLSALAVGTATAGLAILGSTLTNLRVAALAGVIFAVLPRTTCMGIEACSFALSAAFAVWVTVIRPGIVRSKPRRCPRSSVVRSPPLATAFKLRWHGMLNARVPPMRKSRSHLLCAFTATPKCPWGLWSKRSAESHCGASFAGVGES